MEALIPDLRIMLPQLGLFFAAYFLLGSLLFKPYLKLLEERDARSFGAADELGALTAEADALQSEIDGALSAARDAAAAAREETLATARAKANGAVAKAQADAKGALESAYAKVEANRGALRGEVLAQIDEPVAQAVAKLTQPGKAA